MAVEHTQRTPLCSVNALVSNLNLHESRMANGCALVYDVYIYVFAVVTGFVVENNPEHDVVSLSFIFHGPIKPYFTIRRSKPETIWVIGFDGDNSVDV